MREHNQERSPYFISKCPSGCMHLVWGSMTLHLSEDEFLILASLVDSTMRSLRDEQEARLVETEPNEISLVM
jgi:hypothetical protein